MKKNIFAVCDLEADYARNFMDYLNRKNNIPFEIQAFTTVEGLLVYGKTAHIELLLISGKAMCKEVRDMDIGKIVILSEGVYPPELDRYPSVYKYQSSAEVIREVMACYGEERADCPGAVSGIEEDDGDIGSVFHQLLGRCLKTSFALTLRRYWQETGRFLYLNLEEYAGFEELMGKEFSHNLGDLLYYVRQKSQNLIHRMNGMIQTVNNLDFVPPVKIPADIDATTWEDWEYLLNELVMHSNYQSVVLDMGGGIDSLFPLLDRCRQVYMPVLKDTISVCKLTQFENLLQEWDFSQLLAKNYQGAFTFSYLGQAACARTI